MRHMPLVCEGLKSCEVTASYISYIKGVYMKVSGAMKALIKKIIFIKNQNYDAETERAIFDHLRDRHRKNYFDAMNKSMKAPYSKLLGAEPPTGIKATTFIKGGKVY